jgi:hypothetical protein
LVLIGCARTEKPSKYKGFRDSVLGVLGKTPISIYILFYLIMENLPLFLKIIKVRKYQEQQEQQEQNPHRPHKY